MINFNKKDSVADAIKVLIQQEEQKSMDIQYGKDEAEETPARKSIKATGGAPITQPKVGVVAKEEVETVDEALKGNQHKIDKNHNNKIDAQDFKILRGKKTLKSFKEQFDENSIYDQMIQEVLSKDASAGKWIHDFVHSDNPKFAGKSKEQRKKQALAAYYAKQRNEETEQVEEGVVDAVKKVAKKVGEVLGGPDDEGHKKDLQRKMGVPQTGKQSMAKQNEEVEELDEKLDQTKKTMDTLEGRKKVPAGTHNQHSDTKVELNSEGWDDMVKAAKDSVKSGPKPSGGSGVKQGTRYGGGKQKDEPEKKEVKESKRPEDDSVPFAPPYNTTSAPADRTDKSGAVHTPMSRAKHLAKLAMGRVKKDLGQKGK